MEWLKPALVFMALSSAVVAASFLYVGMNIIRRHYVFVWAFAWLAAIPHLAGVWWLQDHPTHHWVWAVHLIFLALNAQLLLAGCHQFVHQRFPTRALLAITAISLIWARFAPSWFDNFLELTLPGALLFGLSYLWMAKLFLRLHWERGTRGARALSLLFLAAGLHEFDYPLLGNSPWGAPAGYALASVFALAIGLGLLIMVLEESRADADSQRARVGAILDNLPVGVMVTDPGGNIQILNGLARAVVQGVDAELPLRLEELEPRLLRSSELREAGPEELPIARALRTGTASPAYEMQLIAADGSTRPVLVNASPVRDSRGQLLGAIGVFQDMQELKRMQAEVARSQKLQGLGTLAAGVAHDFNNALTMVLGHTEIALASTADPAVREQLAIIAQVASDSAAIVRRLQDVARTRAVRDQVLFDLSRVVREVVEITRPRWRDEAQSRGLAFEVLTEADDEVVVAGQPAEIREALLNLTFNALDAMPAGGRLSLRVERRHGEAVLSVIDSGTGMSASVRDRIFDPFFTTKGQRGNGLGLAVVFSIVQRHSGTIAVDSTPGRGTTFTLSLPLAEGSPAATSEPVSTPVAVAKQARLKLLVVDDESLVRSLTASLLSASGHEVEVAASGPEALARLEAGHFDIVLTDLGMPGMNGWEVAHAVGRTHPSTRVVLVTGWGETISGDEERRAGVARVLSKPFTRAQLLDCVAEVARMPLAATVAVA